MRIVVIDEDDAAAALAALNAALGTANGAKPSAVVNRPALEAKKKAAAEETETIEVSKQAYETWQWLVANDRISGIPVAEIATATGVKNAALQWRLRRLVEAHLAYTVKRGFYRAGER